MQEQDPNFLGNITIAAKWWKENLALSPQQCSLFEASLIKACVTKFTNHWFVNNPMKGQAFRSISFDKFTKPDPLLREVAADIQVDIGACFPKYLEHCIMWIDPNSVIVKTCWSYSSKNTEEVLYPKTKPAPPNALQFANPYTTHLTALASPQSSPVKSQQQQAQSGSHGHLSKLALPLEGQVHKSNLNKAEAMLWKQFCGQQVESDNNVETNRIFA